MNWSTELWPGEITIERDKRQRRELVDIDSLAASIKARGQLQPIVITRDNVLVAGERRHAAVSALGDRPLRCVFTDEVNPGELQALELEENMKRLDLDWRDRCMAILRYHEYRLELNPEWRDADTAESLIITKGSVSQHLMVAREIRSGNKMISDSPKFSTAIGIVERKASRAIASETAQLLAVASSVPLTKPKPSAQPASSEAPAEDEDNSEFEILADLEAAASGFILNEDFRYWAESYSGPKFNLIHCDFPYGINMQKSDQSSADAHGTYEDSPEVYWSLIDALLNNLDNFCSESAHLVFWFSMEHYQTTFDLLSSKFKVSRFPLVWHKSDNSGILPDPNRGPRRVYETAFLASRGDRKIVRPVSNLVGASLTRGKHMSEKSTVALQHFLSMLVDEHTALLDPTCGSGSALRAAAGLGASRYLGLELNTEFADLADEALKEFLKGLSNAQSN